MKPLITLQPLINSAANDTGKMARQEEGAGKQKELEELSEILSKAAAAILQYQVNQDVVLILCPLIQITDFFSNQVFQILMLILKIIPYF